MKNDLLLTFEKGDLVPENDMEFSDDLKGMTNFFATYFDTDRKFGVNTKDHDGAWVNLYAEYNPFNNTIDVNYIVETDDINEVRSYTPSETEKEIFIELFEEQCIKENGLKCKDVLINYYFDNADKISLVCEKKNENEFQIRNTYDDFVILTEDATGILKDHVDHNIELAIYNHGNDEYEYAIECTDCYEVLYSPEETEKMDIGMGMEM